MLLPVWAHVQRELFARIGRCGSLPPLQSVLLLSVPRDLANKFSATRMEQFPLRQRERSSWKTSEQAYHVATTGGSFPFPSLVGLQLRYHH
jgi:hypothetical protein